MDRRGDDRGNSENTDHNVGLGAQYFISSDESADHVCCLGEVAFNLAQASRNLL